MNDYLTATGYGFTTNDVNEKEITAKALLKVLDFAPRFKSWLEEVGCCPHEFPFTGKEDSNQNPNVVVVGQNKEPLTYSHPLRSGILPLQGEIVLRRGCWLTQTYCPSTVDDAPPTDYF